MFNVPENGFRQTDNNNTTICFDVTGGIFLNKDLKKVCRLLINPLAIIGLVSMLYGIVVFLARSGTGFWLIWEAIGCGMIGYAIARKIGILDRIPKVIRYIGRSVVAVVLALIVACVCLVMTQFNAKGEKSLDYIIVLGAQVRTTGPSVVLRYRLDTAIDYLNANPTTKCIVSGGQGYNEPTSEAQGMKDYMVAAGISEDRIIMESESTTTIENILFSKAILERIDPDYESVGIVTNNFHAYRGMQIAKTQGLRNVCAVSAPSHPRFLANNVLRECFGITKDFLKGNL